MKIGFLIATAFVAAVLASDNSTEHLNGTEIRNHTETNNTQRNSSGRTRVSTSNYGSANYGKTYSYLDPVSEDVDAEVIRAQSEDALSLKYRSRSSYSRSSYSYRSSYGYYGGYGGGSVIIIGGGYYSPNYGYYSSDTRCVNMTCEFCCFEGVCRDDAFCKELNEMSAGAIFVTILMIICCCACCLAIAKRKGTYGEMIHEHHSSHNSSFSSNGGHKHHHQHENMPYPYPGPVPQATGFPAQEPLLAGYSQPVQQNVD